MENPMKEIGFINYCPVTGKSYRALEAIKGLDESQVKEVEPKGQSWNTGHMNYNRKQAWKIYNSAGFCTRVVEIWFRQDGWHNRAFVYESEKAYDEYKPESRMPYNIEKEVGMNPMTGEY